MLSLLTYNVMFNDTHIQQRHTALIKLLLRVLPDVICLQEVRAPLVAWFITQLSNEYNPTTYELLPHGRGYGELVFTRYHITQLSHTCICLPSKMGRALQHITIEADGAVYNIITFHFESMNCLKRRQQQLNKLWEYTRTLENVIACGDTNQTAKEICVVPMTMYDVIPDKPTYFSGRFWDGDRRHRYDKVWCSKNLETHASGIVGDKCISHRVWISDHNGLLVVLNG